MEDWHPATLRDLDSTDQYDVARSDVIVPNAISLINVNHVMVLVLSAVGLVLRKLRMVLKSVSWRRFVEQNRNYLHEL